MRKILLCPMPYVLCLMPCALCHDASAAVRVGNLSRSYADSYNQVNQQRAYIEALNAAPSVPETLPVPVANAQLADQVLAGENDAMRANLEKCSRIYPNGEFEWAKPTAGAGAGGAPTCVAVVGMYGYQMGPEKSDLLVATVRVAAGDSVKCNISEFPEASWLPAAGQIEFPADAAPTQEDVEMVMNAEQKQNAGLKIAAATVAAAIGGNIVGKNDIGNDGLFGTSKDKVKTTVVGGVGGAALMAAKVYSGKVAGDTIFSAGVNAVAGGVIGNMSGRGDSVLRIETCDNGAKCLWGTLIKGSDYTIDKDKNPVFVNLDDESIVECTKSQTDGNIKDCGPVSLMNVMVGSCKFTDLKTKNCKEGNNTITVTDIVKEYYTLNDKEMKMDSVGRYIAVSGAQRPDTAVPAMIMDVEDKFFGIKVSQWSKLKTEVAKGKIVKRGTNGKQVEWDKSEKSQYTIDDFYPMTVDAEDGGLIDFSNRARMKTTMIGAGAGGAIGAFVGYQGATTDVTNRWLTATQEYRDSLKKVYCQTGGRWLSEYNGDVSIPDMQ